jgi:4'-phosphopantetheinyl transferase
VTIPTVDLWRSDLDSDTSVLDAYWRCLDGDEQARAGRFHFERDRTRFIAARGTLRHILGQYLAQEPERLRLGYGAEGKPHLQDQRDLHFNLSHAGNLLLVAVSQNRPVGVDIERVPSEATVAEVSPRVCSPSERAALWPLLSQARCEAFAEIWARKEAYIKAEGRGLGLELTRIDVSSSRRRVLLQDQLSGAWSVCSRWTLRSLPVVSGYAAAVVGEGEGWRLAAFEWPAPA